jgi:hypothetical protein
MDHEKIPNPKLVKGGQDHVDNEMEDGQRGPPRGQLD